MTLRPELGVEKSYQSFRPGTCTVSFKFSANIFLLIIVMSFQGKHCAPTSLEMYYTEQQQRAQPGPEERGTIGAGFYAALSHLNQVKRTRPEIVSPWFPVIGTLKEAGGPTRESTEEPLEGELAGKE